MLKNWLLKLRYFLSRLIGLEQIKDLAISTYSNSLLQNISLNSYIPRTGMGLKPFAIAYILNEITINHRKTIMEFGSGISTIYMAKLAKINNIDLEIISVDEDYHWVEIIKKILKEENLERFVKVFLAPIESKQTATDEYVWYDEKILDQICSGKKIDLVLVDGPKVSDSSLESIRGRALYYLKNNLAHNFVVFLDDANRRGEKSIIRNWEKAFNIKFNVRSNLAIGYNGKHFMADPIWNYNS